MSEEETAPEDGLSDKHQAFVDEFAISRNATKAYQKVYQCSDETANCCGPLLKKKPAIQAAIIEVMESASERCGVDLDWWLSNVKEGVERCMQHKPVLDSEGKETGEYTFQASPMFKGLELTGKYLGIIKEKHEHSGSITHQFGGLSRTVERLAEFARKRATKRLEEPMQE